MPAEECQGAFMLRQWLTVAGSRVLKLGRAPRDRERLDVQRLGQVLQGREWLADLRVGQAPRDLAGRDRRLRAVLPHAVRRQVAVRRRVAVRRQVAVRQRDMRLPVAVDIRAVTRDMLHRRVMLVAGNTRSSRSTGVEEGSSGSSRLIEIAGAPSRPTAGPGYYRT